ncbi:uncharacterized protein N7482_006632 [Penicillium canariense]|uniref:N-acetyltransferase domain-containing protein n=1 Tax=Penicillium canariense TaxID=189055 RepID=A0A9W9HXI5_9EURO|nr:uncharacterized protein N7482_006632 [Penicillium canariense]KAJ5159628.1 hypothetical protein N7482_006632 [Penicillium canariense]
MGSDSTIYRVVGKPGEPHFQLQSKSIPELTLRVPTDIDIATVIDILENKANSEFDKSISDATAEELQLIAQRWTIVNKPLTHVNFLLRHKEQPLGIAGLGWIGPANSNDASHQAERAGAAGVMLQPLWRGKGYAYEALRVVFEYGIRELGLVEIHVGSHSGNLPMKSLMEKKFGLQPEVKAEELVDQFGNDLLWIVKREEWLSTND